MRKVLPLLVPALAAILVLLLPEVALAATGWGAKRLGFWAVTAIVGVSVAVWRHSRGDGLLGVGLWAGGVIVLILLVRFPPPMLLRLIG